MRGCCYYGGEIYELIIERKDLEEMREWFEGDVNIIGRGEE